MKSLITWWVNNKIAGNILMISIIIIGFFTYFNTGKEPFPNAVLPIVNVSVSWPGASPQEIEEQILLRLEKNYIGINNLNNIYSTAYEGFGQIKLDAKEGTSSNEFLDDVKLRTDSVSNLPPTAYNPKVSSIQTSNTALIIVLYGDSTQKELQKKARDIHDNINQLPGNAIAKLSSQRIEEISIEVSEKTLKQYKLTFDQITHAIQNSSLNISSGKILSAAGTIKINTRKRAITTKDFNQIIIKQTYDGRTLRLKDIANVKDGYKESNFLSEYNGKKAVFVDVELYASPKNDILKTTKNIKKYLTQIKHSSPHIKMEIVYDGSEFFNSQMKILSSSAIYGFFLVLIVLILFLHPTVAIWACAGIVTAFSGAFIFLPITHVSLNMLSFFAFILVLGIIVDDALIVGESIYQHFEKGEREKTAAINGTIIVAKPVIFAVITTIMIFLPWMMVKGVSQFTRGISIVVTLALTFSLIESFLILPGHLSHLKEKKHTGIIGWLIKYQKKISNLLILFAYKIYRPAISQCIKFRYITFSAFISLLMISIAIVISGTLPFNFMPEIQGNNLSVQIKFPENTDNREILNARKKIIAAKEQVNKKYSEIKPSLIENLSLTIDRTNIYARLFLINVKKRDNLPISKIADQFKKYLGEIPLADDINVNFVITGNYHNRFSIRLFSKDTEMLEQAKKTLKEKLRSYNTTYAVRDSNETNSKELRLSLKPGATSTGLSIADITRQVREAYYGTIVQRIARNDQDVEVRLRYPQTERSTLDSLQNFRVKTKNGKEIPLFSLIDYTYENSIRSIKRQNFSRTIRVTTDIIGDDKPLLIQDLQSGFLKEIKVKYPGVNYEIGGGYKERKEFMKEMLMLTGAVLLLMYALLAIAFKSYFQPLLIMSAIVFAITGAIYGLLILKTPLALFSFFGIAAAAGVIINDNLILIDFTNKLREQGVGAFQSLVDAGIARFRPILLTSLTTVAGILPLILEQSIQAQFLKPMVISLGSAILFAFFLTLFLVPSLYAIGIDVVRLYRWALTGKPQPKLGANYNPDISLIKKRIEKTI